jgi:hypothetical protein
MLSYKVIPPSLLAECTYSYRALFLGASCLPSTGAQHSQPSMKRVGALLRRVTFSRLAVSHPKIAG